MAAKTKTPQQSTIILVGMGLFLLAAAYVLLAIFAPDQLPGLLDVLKSIVLPAVTGTGGLYVALRRWFKAEQVPVKAGKVASGPGSAAVGVLLLLLFVGAGCTPQAQGKAINVAGAAAVCTFSQPCLDCYHCQKDAAALTRAQGQTAADVTHEVVDCLLTDACGECASCQLAVVAVATAPEPGEVAQPGAGAGTGTGGGQ
jgi:hypothetical protein